MNASDNKQRDPKGMTGLKVTIESSGSEGMLQIEYKSLDQLDDLIDRLT